MPNNMRERLVEIIRNARMNANPLSQVGCAEADALIANGVTVQEWISVKEPPKKEGRYLVYEGDTVNYCGDGNCYRAYYDESKGGFGKWKGYFGPHSYNITSREWESCPRVTHWMPLPKPPKEG